MKYSNVVKAMLFTSIHELAANPEHYVLHPGKDFSRNRKLGFQRLLLMLLTMEGDCIKEELYRYFGRSTDTPSKAAFYKQRKKVKEDAFRSLLVSFTQKYQKKLLKGKYSLVACDGSAADIFRNPDDSDTFFEPNGKSTRGFNQIHINAFFSVLDKKFTDLLIQPARKRNEYSAFCQMVDRSESDTPVIYLCDRGYASYNAFAHVIESGHSLSCAVLTTRRKNLGFPLMIISSNLIIMWNVFYPDLSQRKNDFILNRRNNTGLYARMSLWIILHKAIPNTDCPCESSGLNCQIAVTKT